MIQNYLKVAIKNLFRFRFVSAINLIGLTLGFAVCSLIYFFVQYEWSYDIFNKNADRIYRINTETKYEGTAPRIVASVAAPMAPHLQRQFAEIEQFVRLIPQEKNTIYRSGTKEITVPAAFAVDSSFFEVFDFTLLQGDVKTALRDPSDIIISKQLATQLFGTENPIGKTLTQTYLQYDGTDTTLNYTIAGVLGAIPANSHLQFDALLNIQNSLPTYNNGQEWHALMTSTYILTKKPVLDITSFEQKMNKSLAKVMPNAQYVDLHMQSLKDVHLGAVNVQDDEYNYQKFDRQYIYIFSVIALIILCIAGVNFTNLSTVIANRRAKEIGIRKVVGASRPNVMIQFLSESLLLTALAAICGILLAKLLLPFIQNFIGREMDAPFTEDTPFLLMMAGLVGLLGVLAGLYPAFYISSFSPTQAFKKLQVGKSPKRLVINSLVVTQFIIASALIAASMVVFLQLDLLKNRDKGFQTAQTITVNAGFGNASRYETLKNEWMRIPGVEAVTAAKHTLGGEIWQNGVQYEDAEGKTGFAAIPCMDADENYFTFYGMTFTSGHNFSKNAVQNGNEYIINETFAKQVGWENPIGKPIRLSWLPETGRIVGVVKDFNFNSLHHTIAPLCVRASLDGIGEFSIKLNTSRLSNTLATLEKNWKQQIPDRAFNYQFLDEHFAKLYDTETRMSRLMSAGTLLGIFIACLGLFGIALFTAEQRTKEIGIRKVLGASVGQIAALLSKDFLNLVLIALLFALPIAWWATNQWLKDFAYRIDLSWWIFVAAGITALAIALLTVSFQAIRAAVANPVSSLRSE